MAPEPDRRLDPSVEALLAQYDPSDATEAVSDTVAKRVEQRLRHDERVPGAASGAPGAGSGANLGPLEAGPRFDRLERVLGTIAGRLDLLDETVEHLSEVAGHGTASGTPRLDALAEEVASLRQASLSVSDELAAMRQGVNANSDMLRQLVQALIGEFKTTRADIAQVAQLQRAAQQSADGSHAAVAALRSELGAIRQEFNRRLSADAIRALALEVSALRLDLSRIATDRPDAEQVSGELERLAGARRATANRNERPQPAVVAAEPDA